LLYVDKKYRSEDFDEDAEEEGEEDDEV